MQPDLENMDMPDLVELLAQNIQTLSHLRENATVGREYDDCKRQIEEIQEVIDQKKLLDERRALYGSPEGANE